MAHEINLLQELPGTVVTGPTLGWVVLAPLAIGVALLIASGLTAYEAETLALRVSQLESAPHAPSADVAPADLAVLEHTLAVHRATLELLGAAGAADRKGFADDFHGLSRQSTEGLWLTGVRLDREGTTVHGRALAPERISTYLAGLRNEPLFAGHPFDTIDLRAPQEPAPGKEAAAVPGALEFTLGSRALLVASGGSAPPAGAAP